MYVYFTLGNWAWEAVSILLFVMFHVFLQPKTSHQPPCTPYRSWTPDPIRIHCGSIHLVLRQNCVLLLGNTDYYHLHRHICRNISQHNVGTRFWSSETAIGVIHFWHKLHVNCEIDKSMLSKKQQQQQNINLRICVYVLVFVVFFRLNFKEIK